MSQARVKAVWEASRKAEAEKEKLRLGHDRVPTIGNGYGSDEDMTPRTVVFKVAPARGRGSRPRTDSASGVSSSRPATLTVREPECATGPT